MTIEEILSEAVSAGASDVHMTAGVSPKMRINGKLVPMSWPRLFPADTLALLVSIMSQAQREQFEERGEYDMSFAVRELGRFRLNAYKQKGCVAMAIRLIGLGIPAPESLGIPPSVIELYQKTRGLVLVTGATGCGKSTTLAAIVDRINSTREAHIITLEEPIEYLHPHKRSMVNQREIGVDTESYATGLRAALREDPDVIMVGELRDAEAISVAVAAAETGHLVLSAMDTYGTLNAVERMIDAFPIQKQSQMRMRIANVLESVVSQQLLADGEQEGLKAAFEVLHVTAEIKARIRSGEMQ